MVINREIQLVILLIFIICVAYANGVSGPFFYDDFGNLERLTAVNDVSSFIQFSLSGFAGPTGRPVSLASFAFQADAWPDNPRAFLSVNVLIHVANSIILFAISRLILKAGTVSVSDNRAVVVAFAAALLWALLPMNVSTSLITVQRMTGLSVFFGLCGILGYVWSYRFYRYLPTYLAFCIQLGILGFFTIISIFSKESGVLFPIYVLVLEVTLLASMSKLHAGRIGRITILTTLFIMLLVYLSPVNIDWWRVSEFRGFSPWERVSSEWVYLWSYVRMTLLPLPTEFSPFHDDAEIVKDGLRVFIAGMAWFVTIFLAFLIRKKAIWPLFAVLWFLTGHLLESTSVLLELVYEHRNYLATYGISFALVVAVFSLPEQFGSVRYLVVFGYIFLIGLICYGLTSIWGDPLKAAEIWSAENPRSSRAALHLATLDIEASGGSRVEASMSILERAKRDRQIIALDRTIAKCPECTAVKLQAILLACDLRGEEEVRIRFQQAKLFAGERTASRSLVDALFPLINFVGLDSCSSLRLSDVAELIEKLRHSKYYAGPYYQSRFAYQLAEISYRLGDIERAEIEIYIAEQADPKVYPVLKMQVHLAVEKREWERAVAAIIRRKPFVGEDLILTDNLLSAMLDEVRQLQEGASYKNVPVKQ